MPLSYIKKSFILIAVLMGLALFAWRLFSTPPGAPPSGIADGPAAASCPVREPPLSFPVVGISQDWWESAGTIYYGIPARILFRLGNDPFNRPEALAKDAWNEFDRIGNIFNPFDPCSDLSIFNKTKRPGRITVSPDIIKILTASRQLWLESNGFFDPTAWRIKQLWMDAEKKQLLPKDIDIIAALASTGFDKIDMNDPSGLTVAKTEPEITLDFGGIVKGYAVDRVRGILEEAGVTAGLVQLGGEISAFGDNDGNPWRIGIQHPTIMNQIYGIVSHHGHIRISTSGNYRQALHIENQTFYHIFNPKTGYPVTDEILGVTTADFSGRVSSAVIDGAATAITVMGFSPGMAFAQQLGIEAMILYKTADGSIGAHYTPGFLEYYQR
ncbi:MAG: FAD:protein FMN transferase [Desulfobacteraceae bacterium]|jgi:thiamine biosynthesis lipoprotein|nr:MAG: FAD:protein FMN transferase [Desulfobacteraceae bacterium]